MKILFLIALCITLANAADHEKLWNEFKHEFSKTYKSLRDEQIRFNIFLSSVKEIEEHNIRYQNGEETYTKGINQFSDLTKEEFEENYLMKELPEIETIGSFKKLENVTLPEYVNWIEKGAVFPIRDQGSCGSCWAFSALGALEGQVALKHNIKVSLSPQELVDCTRSYSNFACKGGWPKKSYDYIKDHGIAPDVHYPYIGLEGNCRNQTTRANLKVLGYENVTAEDEEALKQAVATVGPVSVLIVADWIRFYQKGIFSNILCVGNLNHAVLVVGYGTENGHDYWIVKNSWGTSWGHKGYIRMSRNKMNQCGIAAFGVYPVIA